VVNGKAYQSLPGSAHEAAPPSQAKAVQAERDQPDEEVRPTNGPPGGDANKLSAHPIGSTHRRRLVTISFTPRSARARLNTDD
jgi:hypothetical protein